MVTGYECIERMAPQRSIMLLAIGAAKIKEIELGFGDSRRKNHYCEKPMLALSKLRQVQQKHISCPRKPGGDALKAVIESGPVRHDIARSDAVLLRRGLGAPADETAKTAKATAENRRRPTDTGAAHEPAVTAEANMADCRA
jgi:hypothetical protein